MWAINPTHLRIIYYVLGNYFHEKLKYKTFYVTIWAKLIVPHVVELYVFDRPVDHTSYLNM